MPYPSNDPSRDPMSMFADLFRPQLEQIRQEEELPPEPEIPSPIPPTMPKQVQDTYSRYEAEAAKLPPAPDTSPLVEPRPLPQSFRADGAIQFPPERPQGYRRVDGVIQVSPQHPYGEPWRPETFEEKNPEFHPTQGDPSQALDSISNFLVKSVSERPEERTADAMRKMFTEQAGQASAALAERATRAPTRTEQLAMGASKILKGPYSWITDPSTDYPKLKKELFEGDSFRDALPPEHQAEYDKLYEQAKLTYEESFPGSDFSDLPYDNYIKLDVLANYLSDDQLLTYSDVGGDWTKTHYYDYLKLVPKKDRPLFMSLLQKNAERRAKEQGREFDTAELGRVFDSSGQRRMRDIGRTIAHYTPGTSFEDGLEYYSAAKKIVRGGYEKVAAPEGWIQETQKAVADTLPYMALLQAGRIPTAAPGSFYTLGTATLEPDALDQLKAGGMEGAEAKAYSLGLAFAQSLTEGMAPGEMPIINKALFSQGLKKMLWQGGKRWATESAEEFYQGAEAMLAKWIAEKSNDSRNRGIADPWKRKKVEFDWDKEFEDFGHEMRLVPGITGILQGGPSAVQIGKYGYDTAKANKIAIEVLKDPNAATAWATQSDEHRAKAKAIAEAKEPSRKQWKDAGLPSTNKETRARIAKHFEDAWKRGALTTDEQAKSGADLIGDVQDKQLYDDLIELSDDQMAEKKQVEDDLLKYATEQQHQSGMDLLEELMPPQEARAEIERDLAGVKHQEGIDILEELMPTPEAAAEIRRDRAGIENEAKRQQNQQAADDLIEYAKNLSQEDLAAMLQEAESRGIITPSVSQELQRDLAGDTITSDDVADIVRRGTESKQQVDDILSNEEDKVEAILKHAEMRGWERTKEGKWKRKGPGGGRKKISPSEPSPTPAPVEPTTTPEQKPVTPAEPSGTKFISVEEAAKRLGVEPTREGLKGAGVLIHKNQKVRRAAVEQKEEQKKQAGKPKGRVARKIPIAEAAKRLGVEPTREAVSARLGPNSVHEDEDGNLFVYGTRAKLTPSEPAGEKPKPITPAEPKPKKQDLSHEAVVEKWLASKGEDRGFTERRQTLVTRMRQLVKRMIKSQWKTFDELTVKNRQGQKDSSLTGRNLRELRELGVIQAAWDKTGMPYYALADRELPEWLTKSDTEENMAALPGKPITVSEPKPKKKRGKPAPAPSADTAAELASEPKASESEAILKKAGIKLKKTKPSKRYPKGQWSVTGTELSEEIADGLKEQYEGRRTRYGYSFSKDPTEGLVNAAGAIAEAAKQDSAAEAAGLVKTGIGYLTEEVAERYEQIKQVKLEIAREELGRRNEGVADIVANAVSPDKRAAFKGQLIAARNRGGDQMDVKNFDEVWQFAQDNPKHGLSHLNESELFDRLAEEAWAESDEGLEAKIDDEAKAIIADSIEEEIEESDLSFDDWVDQLEEEDVAEPSEAEPTQAEIDAAIAKEIASRKKEPDVVGDELRQNPEHRKALNEVLGDFAPDGKYGDAHDAEKAKDWRYPNSIRWTVVPPKVMQDKLFAASMNATKAGEYFSANYSAGKNSHYPDAVAYKVSDDVAVYVTGHDYLQPPNKAISKLNQKKLPRVPSKISPKKPKPKKKRRRTLKQQMAELKEHFTPGEIVKSYGNTWDKVISYKDNGDGTFSVEVIEVDEQGNELEGAHVRRHGTIPSDRDIAATKKKRGPDTHRASNYNANLPQNLGGQLNIPASDITQSMASTDGGKKLIEKLRNDHAQKRRIIGGDRKRADKRFRVGLRSIFQSFAKAIHANIVVSKSQITGRHPGQYKTRHHTWFTKSGTHSGINWHEGGHALLEVLMDRTELPEQFKEQLTEFAESQTWPVGMASAVNFHEGMAEMLRMMIFDPDVIPQSLMASFESHVAIAAPGLLDIIKDHRLAFLYHNSRPNSEQYQTSINDNKHGVLPFDVRSVAFANAYRIIGNSAASSYIERRMWEHVKNSPEAVGKEQKKQMFSALRELNKELKDTEADVDTVFQIKLHATQAISNAMYGSDPATKGIRVHVFGNNWLDDELITALADVGIEVPAIPDDAPSIIKDGETKKQPHGFMIQIHDESMQDVKETLGEDWEAFLAFGQRYTDQFRWNMRRMPYPEMDTHPPAKLKQWLDQTMSENPTWLDQYKRIEKIYTQSLLLEVLSGELSVGTAVKMKEEHENYWSLPRQVENRDTGNAGRTGDDPSGGIRRAHGSYLPHVHGEKALGDRLRNAINAYYDIAAKRSVVRMQEIVHKDKSIPLKMRKWVDQAMVKLEMDTKLVATLNELEVAQMAVKAINAHNELEMGDDFEPITVSDLEIEIDKERIWRGDAPKMSQVLSLFDPKQPGTRQYFFVPDQIVYALASQKGDPTGPVGKAASKMLTIGAELTAPWKRMLTRNPVFATRNLPRDVITNLMLGEYWEEMIPFYAHAVGAWVDLFGKDVSERLATETLSHSIQGVHHEQHKGIVGSFKAMMREGIIIPEYDNMDMAQRAMKLPGQLMSTAMKPIDMFNWAFLGYWSSAHSEAAGRLGSYHIARKHGATPMYAQKRLDRATGNFIQHSNNSRIAEAFRWMGFMNPAMQVFWQLGDNALAPDRHQQAVMGLKGGIVAALAAGGAGFTYLSWMAFARAEAGDDDEKYEEIMERKRQNEINRSHLDRERYFRVGPFKLPFEYGPVGAIQSLFYVGSMDLILDYEGDKESLIKAMWDKSTDLFNWSNFVPPQAKLWMELANDYKYYFEEPVIADTLKRMNKTPYLQTWDDTPGLYKDVARGLAKHTGDRINWSPEQIRHSVRSLASSLGDNLVSVASNLKDGNSILGEEPADWPVIGRLMAREPIGYSSQPVKTLKADREEYEGLMEKIKDARKHNDSDYLAGLEERAKQFEITTIVADLVDEKWAELEDLRDSGNMTTAARKKVEREMTELAALYFEMVAGRTDDPRIKEQVIKPLSEELQKKYNRVIFSLGRPERQMKGDKPKRSKFPGNSDGYKAAVREWNDKKDEDIDRYNTRLANWERLQAADRKFIEVYEDTPIMKRARSLIRQSSRYNRATRERRPVIRVRDPKTVEDRKLWEEKQEALERWVPQ